MNYYLVSIYMIITWSLIKTSIIKYKTFANLIFYTLQFNHMIFLLSGKQLLSINLFTNLRKSAYKWYPKHVPHIKIKTNESIATIVINRLKYFFVQLKDSVMETSCWLDGGIQHLEPHNCPLVLISIFRIDSIYISTMNILEKEKARWQMWH